MTKRNLAILGFLLPTAAIVIIFLQNPNEQAEVAAFPQGTVQSLDESSNRPDPNPRLLSLNSTDSIPTQSQIELALEEIGIRLDYGQTEEALNELNGILENYEYLSDTEKIDLVTAYANFFLKTKQNDDARFFFEQILSFPDLPPTYRQNILQMLARISAFTEDWDGFLAYNDQYFSEGGEYNWLVTSHLLGAYRRLGNFNAAGQTLLLHLQTGINPQYDGSDEQYEKLYGYAQDLPLSVSDKSTALQIAQGMVVEFDRPENWKVLSEVYESLDDQSNFNQVLETARQRGFINTAGNWELPTRSQ